MTQKKFFFFFLIIFMGVLGIKSVGAVSLYGQLDHTTCGYWADGMGVRIYTTDGMTGHVDHVCWFGSITSWTGFTLRAQTDDYQNGLHVSGESTIVTKSVADLLPYDPLYKSGCDGSTISLCFNEPQWHCAVTDFDLNASKHYVLEIYDTIPWCGSTSSSAYVNASYDTFTYPTRYQYTVKDLAWSFGEVGSVAPMVDMIYPSDEATTTDFSTWQLEFNVGEAGSGTVDVKYGLSGYFTYTDTVSYTALDTEVAPVNIPKSRLLSPDTYNVYAILRDSEGDAIDTSELNYFEVKSGAYFNNNYYEPPPTGTSTPTVTCDPESGFFNESICKMMKYLFSPDPNQYNDLVGLKDELNEKAPFAYFTLAKNLVASFEIATSSYPESSIDLKLFNNTTTTIPLMTFESSLVSKDDFNQVRTMFGYVLWLMFLSYLFARPLEMLTNKK